MKKIVHLRRHHHFGPARIVMYLARYHDVTISVSGVWRILKRLGLNRLPATQRYQCHDQRRKRYENGWVRSGDFGTVDEEGRLYFRGRQKNMIKRSGENISPEEVESVLAEDEHVSEALVFGVPDRVRSEEVAALIVIGKNADVSELMQRAGERLVRWKLPRFVRLTTEPLPRLGNVKIDRALVRRSFEPAAYTDRVVR